MFGRGGDVIACPLALDHLKTEGSFVSYGEAIRPTEFALDFDTLRCTAPPGELYEGLDVHQRERASAAEDYLLAREGI